MTKIYHGTIDFISNIPPANQVLVLDIGVQLCTIALICDHALYSHGEGGKIGLHRFGIDPSTSSTTFLPLCN